MKLQLFQLFLASGLFQNTLAKKHRVKIQNERPQSKGRELNNFQCTLMIKAVMLEDGVGGPQHIEEQPECLIEGSALPFPLVNMPSWLSENLHSHPFRITTRAAVILHNTNNYSSSREEGCRIGLE